MFLLATVREIARMCGVSAATVSRALRFDPRISASTRERVLRAARDAGYALPVPAALAAGTVEVEFVIFGLQKPLAGETFFGELYKGASDRLAQSGLRMLQVGLNERAHLSDTCNRILNGPPGRAYLLGWGCITAEFVRSLRDGGIPFVVVGTDLPGVATNLVGVDEFGGTYRAARHLIRSGRQRLSYIMAMRSDTACQRKLAGCRAAMAEYRMEMPNSMVEESSWSEEGGYEAMRRLLGSTCPDAVLSSDDSITLGAMRFAQEQGLRVPGDIAFVGFDDLPFSGYTSPALTTVHVPCREIGKTAVELLLQVIAGQQDRTTKVLYDPHLVIRESCGTRQGPTPGGSPSRPVA